MLRIRTGMLGKIDEIDNSLETINVSSTEITDSSKVQVFNDRDFGDGTA